MVFRIGCGDCSRQNLYGKEALHGPRIHTVLYRFPRPHLERLHISVKSITDSEVVNIFRAYIGPDIICLIFILRSLIHYVVTEVEELL